MGSVKVKGKEGGGGQLALDQPHILAFVCLHCSSPASLLDPSKPVSSTGSAVERSGRRAGGRDELRGLATHVFGTPFGAARLAPVSPGAGLRSGIVAES